MHFVVLVVGDDPESQLAPFQENNMDNCPEEYLEFDDNTEEWQEEYEKGKIEAVKIGKKYYLRGDKKFKHKDKDGIGYTYDFPKGSKIEKVPLNKIYKTFDKYCRKYHGVEANEDGCYGYTSNPNSHWDYYQMGGRWAGLLILKPGCIGDQGERSWGNENEPPLPYNHVSQAKKGDVDWDVMHKTQMVALEKEWDEYAKTGKNDIFRDVGEFKTKEQYLEAHLRCFVHAILQDGEWIDEPTGKQTKKIIDNLDDDTLLTLVDCHV